MQKRLCDSGWSDEMKFWGCGEDEGTEKHRLHHCPIRRDVRNQIPEGLGKWEQRSNTSKEDWTWHRGISSYLLSGINWRKTVCHVSQTMGKHRSWSMPVDGFRDHVATDGSLLRVAGPWCACG